MSLRRNLKINEMKDKKVSFNIPSNLPTRPLLTVDTPVRPPTPVRPNHPVDIPEPHSTTETSYIFVSDVKLNDDVRNKFKQLNIIIVEFNFISFQNKKLNDLDIKHIWLNISNIKAKNYLASNLQCNKKYKIITVSTNLNENWVNDIDKYIYKRFKLKQLKANLLTLTYSDFIDNIKNHVDINEVPNKLLELFGVINTTKNKKKILKLVKSFLINDIPIHLLILACNNIAPCLSAALEILKLVKDTHDVKELIITAIDKKEK